MFLNLGIIPFGELLRKFVFSVKTQISVYHNSCLQRNSSFFLKIWVWWDVILALRNVFLLSDMSKFIFYFILLISMLL